MQSDVLLLVGGSLSLYMCGNSEIQLLSSAAEYKRILQLLELIWIIFQYCEHHTVMYTSILSGQMLQSLTDSSKPVKIKMKLLCGWIRTEEKESFLFVI